MSESNVKITWKFKPMKVSKEAIEKVLKDDFSYVQDAYESSLQSILAEGQRRLNEFKEALERIGPIQIKAYESTREFEDSIEKTAEARWACFLYAGLYVGR